MGTYRPILIVLWLAILVAIASCVSTNLPPIDVSGGTFEGEEDEKRIWLSAQEIERRFDKSGLLYEDRELEVYLNGVVRKLLANKLQGAEITTRVKLIRHPFINAFTLPHGAIYFHTGMLARMENEAQLATVLGHELVHFIHRHALKEMRHAQNKVALLRIMQLFLVASAGAAGGVPGAAVVGQLTGEVGALWALASISGHSQESETEADEEGFRAMVQAGYDPTESLKVFEHLQQEMDERRINEPFFFGTHPRLQERIENYQRLLRSQDGDRAMEARRIDSSEEFLSRISKLLLENAVLDLEIGRLKTAQSAIDRHLKLEPINARAHFLLGEVHRRSGRDQVHIEQAIAAYREASHLNPVYADPHRELGLLYRAQNRLEEARAEFERYLALSPKAVDSPIIQGYLAELRR